MMRLLMAQGSASGRNAALPKNIDQREITCDFTRDPQIRPQKIPARPRGLFCES